MKEGKEAVIEKEREAEIIIEEAEDGSDRFTLRLKTGVGGDYVMEDLTGWIVNSPLGNDAGGTCTTKTSL